MASQDQILPNSAEVHIIPQMCILSVDVHIICGRGALQIPLYEPRWLEYPLLEEYGSQRQSKKTSNLYVYAFSSSSL